MSECQSCYNKLDNSNRLFYYDDNMDYHVYNYCLGCTQYLKSNLITNYITELKREDCIVSLKWMLNNGIPYKLDENIDELIINDKRISTNLADDIEHIININDELYSLYLKLEYIEKNEIKYKIESILNKV